MTMPRLFDHTGRTIMIVDQPFDEGGEATVHTVDGDPTSVAKLYRPGLASDDRHRKLRVMITKPPADPSLRLGHVSIAWPSAVLFDARRRFVGFLMPRIDTTRSVQINRVWTPKRRHHAVTWRHLVRIARNLTSAIAAVHAAGHVIGDINERNVLVSNNALVTLVDCDSMQVTDRAAGRTYRCEGGVAEFTPPELMVLDFRRVDRDEVHDRFGLAVALFQLLMEGRHPFGNSVNPEIRQNIALNTTYITDANVRPPTGTPPLQMLPPTLVNLFRRCFGIGHASPQRRPTCADWGVALKHLERTLVSCPSDPSHTHASHLHACPWCGARHSAPTVPSSRLPAPSPHAASHVSRWRTASAATARTVAPRPPVSPGPATPRTGTTRRLVMASARALGTAVVWLLRTLGTILTHTVGILWSLVPPRNRAATAFVIIGVIIVLLSWPYRGPLLPGIDLDFVERAVAASRGVVVLDPTTSDQGSSQEATARPHGVISEGEWVLPTGRTVIDDAIVIDGSLTIRGAGADLSTLVITAGGDALRVTGGGVLSLEHVTVERSSATPGAVVHLDGGAARISGARLLGGTIGRGSSGAGVSATGSAQATLTDTDVVANGPGVVVLGGARLTMHRGSVRANAAAGVYVGGSAHATVRGVDISANAHEGIVVTDRARIDADRMTVHANLRRGVSFLMSATGVVANTTVSENGRGAGGADYWQGIGVQDDAPPTITSSLIADNAGVGIQFLHQAGGVARDNELLRNGANYASYLEMTGLSRVSEGGIALGRPDAGDVPTPTLDRNRFVANNGGEVRDYRRAHEAIGASFDCALASTWAERMICSEEDLTRLDRALDEVYTRARSVLSESEFRTIQSDQRAWLQEREACRHNPVPLRCLTDLIDQRLRFLGGVGG